MSTAYSNARERDARPSNSTLPIAVIPSYFGFANVNELCILQNATPKAYMPIEHWSVGIRHHSFYNLCSINFGCVCVCVWSDLICGRLDSKRACVSGGVCVCVHVENMHAMQCKNKYIRLFELYSRELYKFIHSISDRDRYYIHRYRC